MKLKKVTFLTLAALLALPAFSSIDASASGIKHASSPGYAEGISNLGGFAKTQPLHSGNIWSRNVNGNNYSLNGKTGQAIINGIPVSGKQALYDINTGTGPNLHQSTGNVGNKRGSVSSHNHPVQYTSKNNLPQTGEVNHQADAIAASIILGATSIVTGASSIILKKREKHASISNKNVITNSGSNNLDLILNNLKSGIEELNKYTHNE